MAIQRSCARGKFYLFCSFLLVSLFFLSFFPLLFLFLSLLFFLLLTASFLFSLLLKLLLSFPFLLFPTIINFTAQTLKPWTPRLYFHFICTFFTYFLTFIRTSQSQPRVEATAETFFLSFSTLFSKWRSDFTQRRRHFSKFFQCFLSITVGLLLPIAGYFTSETIMAVSDGDITTFFIQSQETNEMQHSCFPTMGAIKSLRARDLEISCQSWCYTKTRKKWEKLSVPLFCFTDVIG